jgi:hypothetical protein
VERFSKRAFRVSTLDVESLLGWKIVGGSEMASFVLVKGPLGNFLVSTHRYFSVVLNIGGIGLMNMGELAGIIRAESGWVFL